LENKDLDGEKLQGSCPNVLPAIAACQHFCRISYRGRSGKHWVNTTTRRRRFDSLTLSRILNLFMPPRLDNCSIWQHLPVKLASTFRLQRRKHSARKRCRDVSSRFKRFKKQNPAYLPGLPCRNYRECVARIDEKNLAIQRVIATFTRTLIRFYTVGTLLSVCNKRKSLKRKLNTQGGGRDNGLVDS
jgi:hypothetical protein